MKADSGGDEILCAACRRPISEGSGVSLIQEDLMTALNITGLSLNLLEAVVMFYVRGLPG
jgi:hypothetical protein